MNNQKRFPACLIWLLILVITAAAIRVFVWQTYEPGKTSDSEGYELMAHLLYTRSFSVNYGARPPGYPALLVQLAMTKYGLDELVIWRFQAFLGIVGAVVLFWITWKWTRRGWLALLAGLMSALNLSLVYFEPMIMTETVSAFLVLTCLVLAGMLSEKNRIGFLRTLLLGGLLGFSGLTRPILLYLVPVLLVFLWLFRWAGQSLWRRLGYSLVYLIPALVMVLGWSRVNWQTTGVFGVTTLTGYNLINHTGGFIELAPEQYADVRDVYLKYRAIRMAEAGNQSMTIWRAYPELVEVTGLNYTDLSLLLTDLSLDLILRNPMGYLSSVANAWLGFWKVPNYWRLENIHPTGLVGPLQKIWQVERLVLLGVNFIFLAMGFYWAWLRRKRKYLFSEVLLVWLYVVVMLGAFAQAAMDYGENPRYGVPFQSLIIWVVLIGLWTQRAEILSCFQRIKRCFHTA